jgi:hypothetical protein
MSYDQVKNLDLGGPQGPAQRQVSSRTDGRRQGKDHRLAGRSVRTVKPSGHGGVLAQLRQ